MTRKPQIKNNRVLNINPTSADTVVSAWKMESADDILDEEKKNQKQQRPLRPGRIQRVERDW